MNYVDAVKDRAKIEQMKTQLLKGGLRNYLMFVIGIHTGRRIGDILSLKVKDVMRSDYLYAKEQKTGKKIPILITAELRKELERYCDGMNANDYLFASREGANKPISTGQAWNIMSNAGKACGLNAIGTHTLRKTFGYWYYKDSRDLATLMLVYGHHDPKDTLRYIGIDQEQIDDAIQRVAIIFSNHMPQLSNNG